MTAKEKLTLGADLSRIRNSNEKRVLQLLPMALEEFPGYEPTPLDVEDIYALALNHLPPRYKQLGTVEITGRIPDAEIIWEIGNAIRKVRSNPTGQE